jgi:hypothetical protein
MSIIPKKGTLPQKHVRGREREDYAASPLTSNN